MEDSLRGQNKDRRIAGTGSSPVLPIKSTRTKLWKQLRKLDAKINKISHWLDYDCIYPDKRYKERLLKKNQMDQHRKKIRLKLKGY